MLMAGLLQLAMVFTMFQLKEPLRVKKVNALRVGEGAGNYFAYYAYKKASLAK